MHSVEQIRLRMRTDDFPSLQTVPFVSASDLLTVRTLRVTFDRVFSFHKRSAVGCLVQTCFRHLRNTAYQMYCLCLKWKWLYVLLFCRCSGVVICDSSARSITKTLLRGFSQMWLCPVYTDYWRLLVKFNTNPCRFVLLSFIHLSCFNCAILF